MIPRRHQRLCRRPVARARSRRRSTVRLRPRSFPTCASAAALEPSHGSMAQPARAACEVLTLMASGLPAQRSRFHSVAWGARALRSAPYVPEFPHDVHEL